MANDIEALGALTTAGLAASALDAPARRWWQRDVSDHAPGICANCETVLIGEFCHVCGQRGHIHRSVGHVFEEFLHGILHFDSKAWRTLPLLAFRPGKLTWDYIHGKRARFIAPIALFLLSIFLMFFVFGFVGAPDFGRAVLEGSRLETVAEADAAIAGINADIAASEIDLATARRGGDAKAVDKARAELAAQRAALTIIQEGRRSLEAGKKGAAPVMVPPGRSWQDNLASQLRGGGLKVNTGIPAVDDNVREALKNPEFALYRVQQKAYKLSFLLVPMSLPVLWLMFFWRRDTTIYDHVVFSLYSLSFMSLLLVLAVVLVKAENAFVLAGGPALGWLGLLWLVPPIHMFAQLKGGYRLSTWGALWRVSVLGLSSLINLGMFAGLIVILGLAD